MGGEGAEEEVVVEVSDIRVEKGKEEEEEEEGIEEEEEEEGGRKTEEDTPSCFLCG